MHMMGRSGEQMHVADVRIDAEVMNADDHGTTQSLWSMLQQALDEIRNPDLGHNS